ncbi:MULTISPECIES: nitrogen fixation protein NifZ [unclassified Bradyrhizobium]|uniref:nitrogen fixation protein NifZ n=1 Tax=unclassified Bradyrhizobium TaxID=2631580 RepID=UPI00247A1707|nr:MULTISPECIES: nitrogen fixation protein NifZ [unclassified Bradyrhizobium]WGS19385.1 nitrogen fixation protein NifZ [Bradyrhizobium sp. ISRA463]WGS26221.1 nitrogen fixation protein NifZ [Bradyrhizobium sp. ISRA464]
MTETGLPKYRSGQRVKTAVDLINDDSFPDAPADGLLLSAGRIGNIIRVAMHTQADVPIYIVDCGGQLVIGCLEEETALL